MAITLLGRTEPTTSDTLLQVLAYRYNFPVRFIKKGKLITPFNHIIYTDDRKLWLKLIDMNFSTCLTDTNRPPSNRPYGEVKGFGFHFYKQKEGKCLHTFSNIPQQFTPLGQHKYQHLTSWLFYAGGESPSFIDPLTKATLYNVPPHFTKFFEDNFKGRVYNATKSVVKHQAHAFRDDVDDFFIFAFFVFCREIVKRDGTYSRSDRFSMRIAGYWPYDWDDPIDRDYVLSLKGTPVEQLFDKLRVHSTEYSDAPELQ